VVHIGGARACTGEERYILKDFVGKTEEN